MYLELQSKEYNIKIIILVNPLVNSQLFNYKFESQVHLENLLFEPIYLILSLFFISIDNGISLI